MTQALRFPQAGSPPPISVDGLSTAVLGLAPDGRIDFANGSATSLFGGTDLLGRPFGEVLATAEKRGLLMRTAGAALLRAFDRPAEPSSRFEMPDGRVLFGRSTVDADGRRMLEITDITAPVREAEALHRDPLTGLSNRHDFLLRLRKALDEDADTTAVLYVDLDRFKPVNDTLGHPVGDALLKLAVDRMLRSLGPTDVLARVGGDEFAILQTGAEQPKAADTLARRLVDLVGRAYLVKGHMINVGASLGVALSATDGTDPEELVKKADLALVTAKLEGRGTHRFFRAEMDASLQFRRALEMDLRRALVLKELSLAYQPQFSVDGRALVGFEALLRWVHPEKGTISPANFIPLAEEIGLIVPIGEWVLRTACHEAAQWPPEIAVAVNLSPLQFRSPNLVAVIAQALAASGIAPQRLELEITEGALLEETSSVIATLGQIKALGVRVSMDDFGTGYSSLSYLQKFPFDKIKIDQSFVRRMVDDRDSAAIVRAVAALGNSLGMTTVAEGVETEEQLTRISQEGCKQVQGYLTGKPLDPRAALALVRSANPEIPETAP